MSKGQTLVLEFMLFFLISFSLFSIISTFFYNQSQYFKEIVGDRSGDLINDILNIHFIRSSSCKSCHSVHVKDNIPSRIGDHYYLVYVNSTCLNTTLLSDKSYSRESPMFRLNETFNFVESVSSSQNKILDIRINNRDKEVVIS